MNRSWKVKLLAVCVGLFMFGAQDVYANQTATPKYCKCDSHGHDDTVEIFSIILSSAALITSLTHHK